MENNSMEKVHLWPCPAYDVAFIKKCLSKSLQDLDMEIRDMRVLLKPNLVVAKKPDQAVTTHPAIVQALGELLVEMGCTVFVGDSPGYGSAHKVLLSSGIAHIMEQTGLHISHFSDDIIKKSNGISPFKDFVFGDDPDNYDIVINLPKLKSHTMMAVTLGVKNTFGFIHAFHKAKWHMRAGQDRRIFASILIDIHRVANPSLTIIDGIVGMDGDGPSSGRPRNFGILGVAKNAFALDDSIEKLLCLPYPAPVNSLAAEHGLVPPYETINHGVNSVDDFMLPRSVMDTDWRLPSFVKKILKNTFFSKPKVNKTLCKSCGVCAKVCPNKALTVMKKGPDFDYSRCIRCYCCQEMCPEGAIKV